MLPGTWLLPLELLCPSPCRRVRFQLRQVRAVLQLRQVHQVRPSSRDTGPRLSRGPPGARRAPSPPQLGHYGRPSPDQVARATQVTQIGRRVALPSKSAPDPVALVQSRPDRSKQSQECPRGRSRAGVPDPGRRAAALAPGTALAVSPGACENAANPK